MYRDEFGFLLRPTNKIRGKPNTGLAKSPFFLKNLQCHVDALSCLRNIVDSGVKLQL